MGAGGVLVDREPEFASGAGVNIDAGDGLVLTEADFRRLSQLAYEHFGLDLSGGKQGMVAARLSRRVRELGLGSFRSYYDHIVADRTGDALNRLVDDLTTNHTSFFREMQHFDFFALGRLERARKAATDRDVECSLLFRRRAVHACHGALR